MATDTLARALALSSPRVLAQSAVSVSHTGDTAEFTFATIALAANSMGKNGVVEVQTQWTYTASGNAKTLRVRLGATQLWGVATASGSYLGAISIISNVNATNSQKCNSDAFETRGAFPMVTAAIDTTAAQNITITGQLALGTETLVLESYQVILYPRA